MSNLISELLKTVQVLSPEARAEEARKRRERRIEHYQNNTRKYRKNEFNYRARLRLQMVEAYGGECVSCGEVDHVVLVLDHIEDNAPEDKALNGHKGGYHLYAKLKKAGWPKDGYQLLCHNCNYRKEYYRRQECHPKQ